MDRLQICITELQKLSYERERDMLHLRLNHKLNQAQEVAEEMDVLNSAIFFLSEYQVTLNAFQIVKNRLALDKDA